MHNFKSLNEMSQQKSTEIKPKTKKDAPKQQIEESKESRPQTTPEKRQDRPSNRGRGG
jgi:hypothetical protein